MKNEKQLKEFLYHYQVSEVDEERIQMTISKGQNLMDQNRVVSKSFVSFLKNQTRYISIRLLLLQFVAIVVVVFAMSSLMNPATEVPKIIFTTSPILALMAVPELVKSMIYGMSELEYTSKHSLPKILLARLVIIGTINLLALALIVGLLSQQHQMPFIQLLVYGVVPLNIVNGINLCLLQFLKIRSTEILIAASAVQIFMMNVLAEQRIFLAFTETKWFILLALTTLFFFIQLYYFMKNIKVKEGLIQWN